MDIKNDFESEDDFEADEPNNEIIEDNGSDSESSSNIEIDNNIGSERSLKYNQSEYNLDNILRKFMELNIIRNKNICDKCNLDMKLVKKTNLKIKYVGDAKEIPLLSMIIE